MNRTTGLALAAALAWSTGAVAQQGLGSAPSATPQTSTQTAPSVDTGASGPRKAPLIESSQPGAAATTGSVGSSLNPEGNPAGTIDSGPKSGISSGASGRNTCYPGQSGQQVGSTNPAGMPSQCK